MSILGPNRVGREVRWCWEVKQTWEQHVCWRWNAETRTNPWKGQIFKETQTFQGGGIKCMGKQIMSQATVRENANLLRLETHTHTNTNVLPTACPHLVVSKTSSTHRAHDGPRNWPQSTPSTVHLPAFHCQPHKSYHNLSVVQDPFLAFCFPFPSITPNPQIQLLNRSRLFCLQNMSWIQSLLSVSTATISFRPPLFPTLE